MTDSSSLADEPTVEGGAWPPRPRLFWVGMAVFLIVIVFLGFGSTYGRQLVLGLEISGIGFVETDWVIHLHAAVFIGWMALLFAQTVLVADGRTQAHVALGRSVGLAWGVAVLLTGGLITYTQMQVAVSKGLFTWAEAPLVLRFPWLGMLQFVGLASLGLFYRYQSSAHKRFMMLATAALVMAAFGRMQYLLGPWSRIIGFGLMTAPLVGYDLYTEGRVHSATLIGGGVLGLSVVNHLVRHLSG